MHVTTTSEVLKALALAQREFHAITKDSTAQVGTRSYHYADLATILASVKPALIKHDLILSQTADGGVLLTNLYHAPSGQCLTCRVPIAGDLDNAQKFGSALTYARRYGIQLLLGLIAEDDDDGKEASSKPKPILSIQPRPHKTTPTVSRAPSSPTLGAEGATPPGDKSPGGPGALAGLQYFTPLSEKQLSRLFALGAEYGWSEADIGSYAKEKYGVVSRKHLTYRQYEELCHHIEAFPKGRVDAKKE